MVYIKGEGREVGSLKWHILLPLPSPPLPDSLSSPSSFPTPLELPPIHPPPPPLARMHKGDSLVPRPSAARPHIVEALKKEVVC